MNQLKKRKLPTPAERRKELLQMARQSCRNIPLERLYDELKAAERAVEAVKQRIATELASKHAAELRLHRHLVEAASILDQYDHVVINEDMLDALKRHTEPKSLADYLPNLIVNRFGELAEISTCRVSVQCEQVAPITSYGRNGDVDWDCSEDTWSIDGVAEFDNFDARSLMSSRICNIDDPNRYVVGPVHEHGSYNVKRTLHFLGVYVLRRFDRNFWAWRDRISRRLVLHWDLLVPQVPTPPSSPVQSDD